LPRHGWPRRKIAVNGFNGAAPARARNGSTGPGNLDGWKQSQQRHVRGPGGSTGHGNLDGWKQSQQRHKSPLDIQRLMDDIENVAGHIPEMNYEK
jgi:hypothetical protein